jgi:hypothetical protein
MLFVLMTLLTFAGLFSYLTRFFFAGGSTGSLMELITANFFVQLSLLSICGYAGYRLLKRSNKKILILFFIAFFLWLMSGRTISFAEEILCYKPREMI